MDACTKEIWTVSEEFEAKVAIKDYHRATLNAGDWRVVPQFESFINQD
jgi:hypothetical protein